MFLIIRAWRLMRLIESRHDGDLHSPSKHILVGTILLDFAEAKDIFGRPYGLKKSIIAYMYARENLYLVQEDPKDKNKSWINVKAAGFLFSTPSGLVDSLVKTYSWSLQAMAIIISIIALVVSINASK